MSITTPAHTSLNPQIHRRKPLQQIDPSMSASINNGQLNSLWNEDDESFEVQVPDFNFDWKLEKGGKGKGKSNPTVDEPPVSRFSSISLGKTKSRPSSLSPPPPELASSNHARATPPPRQSQSARSSLSSVQVASLTDASTASASSLVPTPPGSGFSSGVRSSSSQHLDSGGSGSGSGSSGRIYGAGRRFQRVVSAPVTRQKYESEENGMLTIEESSNLSFSTTSHTATMRPLLTHTSSTSSIPQEPTSSTVLPTSNYMTPGVTERTLTSTARSTGRRLGGLSKFGGPARRVIPALEPEDVQEESEKASPVLIDSPPRAISPPIYDTVPDVPSYASSSNRNPGLAHLPSRNQYHNSPVIEQSKHSAILEEDIPSILQSHGTSRGLAERSYRQNETRDSLRSGIVNRPDEEDRPFRPFSSQAEEDGRRSTTISNHPQYQQNPPYQSDVGTSIHPQSSRQSPPARDRYSPPPQSLRAARPAPPINVAQNTQTTVANPLTAPPVLGQQGAPGLSVTPTAAPRTSFLVNSIPYERLQRLGKGGSSTVYSVLYSAPPKKRIIYALKVVQLDRADSETYQSYTNEIELLKRLRGHDRVIQLIDHQITFGQGNRPHRLMMVMECGEIDFAALLDEQRGKAINMNFMLEAVQAVHKENVVHTDLKPANFVLVKGRLKIIDFGIAKAIANDTVNIQRDQQIGTVNYMSPEAIQRMNNQKVLKVIADPRHFIDYPEMAVPKATVGLALDGHPTDPASLAVSVSPSAIDTMQRSPAVPPGSTPITQKQMQMLVNFILQEHGLPERSGGDHTAEDLFSQLQAQNALSG
ncbi:hypothetical protein I302_101161 [Kwoniella bestiolae CBS 10118]|uniref:Protein kinase domain-containing protein n=1 Tax=Kwoniella bestiolae CBS 10118 TaxID=1296100 RepID=A0AAJ8K1K3_9TREE